MTQWTLALILTSLTSAAGSVSSDQADARIQLRGIPPPEKGKFGRLGFEIRAAWMNGFLQMRYPETLRTSLGLHFIDHDRRDMPPLSMLDPFPQWSLDEATGEVSYSHQTPEGVEFRGRARPYEDEIHLEYRVKNNTGAPLERAHPQMCLSLAASPDFNKPKDLADVYTWIDGQFTSLARTTPTPEEKGRAPWVQVFTPELKAFRGPREHPNGWWVVDQFADDGIIARVSRGGEHLVAIAWEDAKSISTNTRIPCLHAGPGSSRRLQPGEEAVWRGKIYLMPNDPDALLARYRSDSRVWSRPAAAKGPPRPIDGSG